MLEEKALPPSRGLIWATRMHYEVYRVYADLHYSSRACPILPLLLSVCQLYISPIPYTIRHGVVGRTGGAKVRLCGERPMTGRALFAIISEIQPTQSGPKNVSGVRNLRRGDTRLKGRDAGIWHIYDSSGYRVRIYRGGQESVITWDERRD